MDHVPVRELNQHTAGVLARVEQGETIGITKHGRRIARIVPEQTDPLEEMVARGLIVPPTIPGPLPRPVASTEDLPSASDAVAAMRDEERW